MDKIEEFIHGVSEGGQLVVRKVEKIIDGNIVMSEISSDSYSPSNPAQMDGFDDKSKEIVEAINGITPEVTIIDENGIRKQITFSRRTQGDAVNVREINRFFTIATGKFLGKCYPNTRSYDPGDSAILCDDISKKFIETIHTPEVIAIYEAKIAEQVAT